jgi:hypothetical protein
MSPRKTEFTERFNVFFTPEQMERIRTRFDVKYWFADQQVVRIATTFATTGEEIEALADCL